MIKAYVIKAGQTQPQTVAHRAQLSEIIHMSSAQPFKLSHFESLLNEIDTGIRSAYAQAEVSVVQRGQFEHNMLIEADVPEALMPIVSRLFGNIVSKLQDNVDMGKIYFADVAWLGLRDGLGKGAVTYDVLKKTPLKKGMKLRGCRRCGSMMEDAVAEQGQSRTWIAVGQKFCVCLGYWMLI